MLEYLKDLLKNTAFSVKNTFELINLLLLTFPLRILLKQYFEKNEI